MESNKTIDAIFRWLSIREENGIKFPSSLSKFHADLEHSALLERLLRGQEPLPKAPPKAFSYPNYRLIERGWDNPFEVWKPNKTQQQALFGKGHPEYIMISQSPWHLITENGPDDWNVEWPKRPGEVWRVFCTGKDKFDHKLWRMEKI